MFLFLSSSQGKKSFCNLPSFFFYHPPELATGGVLYKSCIFRSIHRKTSVLESFFIKVADLKTPAHVFSCECRYIHRKTPMLESLFNKVAGLKVCNFIKKRLQPRCFPANIAKFLRAAILKNISKQLPLNFNKKFNQILHE